MKAADLRKSILQAAVQGKLVPQDKSDDPASELLKRIQAEKAVLIKEGKLKKENPLPPITEDENSYDLPEGWVWCRLGNAVSIKSSKRIYESDYVAEGIPFYRSKEIGDLSRGESIKSKFYITKEKYEDIKSRFGIPQMGDILITSVGSIGNCWVSDGREFYYKDGNVTQILATGNIISDYLLLYLKSPLFFIQAIGTVAGTAYSALTIIKFNTVLFPLPPLNEQQRIVAKVDELMALCDELEAAENELDTLEAHFADYLPKCILQAAVQGKLVPQDKNDEPASELLKRIQAEKIKLIKEGKLKKEEPLRPITEDVIPYDLPDGWVWCRLGEIMHGNVGGGTPSKQRAEYWNGNIPWASVKDLNCNILSTTQDTITELGLKESTSNLIPADSIIVCMRMGLGKIAISAIPVAINQDLRALFIPKDKIVDQYFIYWYKTLIINGGGMTVKGITINDLNNMLFPLPPLTEQQRIVAKVYELMALCDELKHVGEQPIDHSNLVPFPAEAEVEPLQMAARGKVSNQPSKKHAEALDDLVEMMGDDD